MAIADIIAQAGGDSAAPVTVTPVDSSSLRSTSKSGVLA